MFKTIALFLSIATAILYFNARTSSILKLIYLKEEETKETTKLILKLGIASAFSISIFYFLNQF